ncbi:MAG TPA: guanylate kinase [Desulfatiglandales bacterium]|nr:guanylate kinase [Desulfatiglandales bacterium]
MNKGQIYVFSGPSGAGKSTLVHRLRQRVNGLGYSVSHTSRAPRGGEVDGVDYHFVDRDTFSRMIENGSFVEWATVYGDFYGTSFSGLLDQIDRGIDVVLDVDYQGAANIKAHYKESVLIYILPPSLEILEKRLRERATDDDDVIDARLRQALDDIRKCGVYDYLIINDDLEEAVEKAVSIIHADSCRTSRVMPGVKEIFGLAV